MSDGPERIWGYCTDCEQHVPLSDDGRGACGHGRVVLPDPRVLALVEALRAADGHLARGHDKMAHNITRAALAAWEA